MLKEVPFHLPGALQPPRVSFWRPRSVQGWKGVECLEQLCSLAGVCSSHKLRRSHIKRWWRSLYSTWLSGSHVLPERNGVCDAQCRHGHGDQRQKTALLECWNGGVIDVVAQTGRLSGQISSEAHFIFPLSSWISFNMPLQVSRFLPFH